jgi:transglutaminase/protease-like cytokinesis protein 3
MKYRYILIILVLTILGCIKILPYILHSAKNTPSGKQILIQHRGNKVSNSEVNSINQKQAEIDNNIVSNITVTDENALTQLIVKNLSLAKDTVVIIKNDSLKKNINVIANNIAENYGYSGYISDLAYAVKGNTVYIHFDYRGGNDYFLRCINVVNSKVKNIISRIITPEMSDFDKELAIHNYIVSNIVYDNKNLQNNTLTVDDFTAYGALIKGSSVCQGYAEAMYRLLNAANINNYIVFGTGNNVSHAWNIAKINGQYYHIDATFDDPISNLGSIISYGYFNLSNSQISVDHAWDNTKYPRCSSISENYYVVNHLIVKDRNSFYNIIKNGLLKKQTVISCKTNKYDKNTFNPQIAFNVIVDNKINYVNTNREIVYDYNKNTCEIQLFIKYK